MLWKWQQEARRTLPKLPNLDMWDLGRKNYLREIQVSSRQSPREEAEVVGCWECLTCVLQGTVEEVQEWRESQGLGQTQGRGDVRGIREDEGLPGSWRFLG